MLMTISHSTIEVQISKNLLISFNSADLKNEHYFNKNTEHFENYKLFEDYKCNVLFFKTSKKDWYLVNIDEIIGIINYTIDKLKIEKLIWVASIFSPNLCLFNTGCFYFLFF